MFLFFFLFIKSLAPGWKRLCVMVRFQWFNEKRKCKRNIYGHLKCEQKISLSLTGYDRFLSWGLTVIPCSNDERLHTVFKLQFLSPDKGSTEVETSI